MESEKQLLERYFNKVSPFLPYLFNLAHAVSGSLATAGTALEYALMEGWLDYSGDGYSSAILRSMTAALVRKCMENPLPDLDAPLAGNSPLPEGLSELNETGLRACVLFFSARMRPAAIARVLRTSAAGVSQAVRQLRSYIHGTRPEIRGKKTDPYARRLLRSFLSAPDPAMPAELYLEHVLMNEVLTVSPSRHYLLRIGRGLSLLLGLILLMVLLFLIIVLLAPAVLEEAGTAASAAGIL